MTAPFSPDHLQFHTVEHISSLSTAPGMYLARARGTLAMRNATDLLPTPAAIFTERALQGTGYSVENTEENWRLVQDGHVTGPNDLWIEQHIRDATPLDAERLNRTIAYAKKQARTQIAESGEYPGLLRIHRDHDIGTLALRAVTLSPGVLSTHWPVQATAYAPRELSYYRQSRRLLDVLVNPGFSMADTRDNIRTLLEY